MSAVIKCDVCGQRMAEHGRSFELYFMGEHGQTITREGVTRFTGIPRCTIQIEMWGGSEYDCCEECLRNMLNRIVAK